MFLILDVYDRGDHWLLQSMIFLSVFLTLKLCVISASYYNFGRLLILSIPIKTDIPPTSVISSPLTSILQL